MSSVLEALNVPRTANDQVGAAIAAQPNKPAMLYLTGLLSDGKTECGHCQHFDETNYDLIADHVGGGKINLVQTEIDFRKTGSALQQIAESMGATLLIEPKTITNPDGTQRDIKVGIFSYSDGTRYEFSGTPALYEIGIGADGKPRITGVIDTDNFEKELNRVEEKFPQNKAKKQAELALSDKAPTGSTVPNNTYSPSTTALG